MEIPPETDSTLADATKRVMWRLMAIVHNRSELLMVEIQEERERTRVMIFLASATAVFGLLAAMVLTAVIALAAGSHYFLALVILTVCYAGGAVVFYFKFEQLRRHWETFSGTREQLEKDHECLEKQLT